MEDCIELLEVLVLTELSLDCAELCDVFEVTSRAAHWACFFFALTEERVSGGNDELWLTLSVDRHLSTVAALSALTELLKACIFDATS